MSVKYKCIQHIDIVEIDDEWIIMDTENFTITKVNAIGAYILERIREQVIIGDIIETISADYAVDVNIISSDTFSFLEELKAIGLVTDERTEVTNS